MLLTLKWSRKSCPKWLAWLSAARSRRWASTFPGNRCLLRPWCTWRRNGATFSSDMFCIRLHSAGENGVAAARVRRGGSPEIPAVSPTPEASSRRPETPSRGSNGDEPPSTATPGRSSGKGRQTIDIRVELEKRQGGKPLLNLVVIGRKEGNAQKLSLRAQSLWRVYGTVGAVMRCVRKTESIRLR